ncbi:ketopantoate reductase C-terminal domain-containing protein [Streptomyces sp. NPDC005096]|uniref:ketopantoate reductase C-terminal domain-containing protein n=1 Tax=Streptomyces sp. NPDC005096 TaxID=3154559 RepID=UPI0033AAFF3E
MLDRAPSQGPVTANVRGQPSCLCQITTITDGGYPGTSRALLRDLMVEVVAVGQASGVQLDEKFADDRLAFCDTLPAGMTSPMHNDLEHGNRLELPWLSGGVAELATRMGVSVPRNQAVADILAPYELGGPATARSGCPGWASMACSLFGPRCSHRTRGSHLSVRARTCPSLFTSSNYGRNVTANPHTRAWNGSKTTCMHQSGSKRSSASPARAAGSMCCPWPRSSRSLLRPCGVI